MEEIKESRDAAATTTETKLPESPPTLPPSHVGPTILPLEAAVLGKAHSSPVHHDLMIAHPYHHPHSPTASRKGIELFSGVPYGGRARSASLGTAYTETPLLVPTSPPPRGSALLLSGGRQKVLSLSPNLHRGETTAGSGGGHHLPVSLLGVPSMVEPPRLSDTQKAMEAAVQAERKRNKEMEQDEKNMTAEELRAVLKRERHRMSRFAADLARLRSAAVQCQAEAEIHEEGRINGLMRRLESLQIEKGRIIVELEREEEMVCTPYCFIYSLYHYISLSILVVLGNRKSVFFPLKSFFFLSFFLSFYCSL